MKILLLVIVLFEMNLLFSQELEKNSIVNLESITVKTNTNKKILTIKTHGKNSVMGFIHNTGEIVSVIQNIPSGKLISVAFYFNQIPFSFFKLFSNEKFIFRDMDFRLVIYEVNDKSFPGKLLISENIRFTVEANEKGKVELDIRPLNLNTQNKLYIGVQSLDKSLGESPDFRISTIISDEGKSMVKPLDSNNWGLIPNNVQLKMKLKIEQ